jgi:hypothetical protein
MGHTVVPTPRHVQRVEGELLVMTWDPREAGELVLQSCRPAGKLFAAANHFGGEGAPSGYLLVSARFM